MDTDRIQHITIKLPVPATGEWLDRLEQLVTEFVGPEVRMEREITPATTRWLAHAVAARHTGQSAHKRPRSTRPYRKRGA